jgi:hypothetical protein
MRFLHYGGIMSQKQNDIPELETLDPNNFANIFNVYDDPSLGTGYKTYSINRTLNFLGMNDSASDDTSNTFFKKYTIENSDTWTSLSYAFYGTISLWWLIAKSNNITNPTIDPVPGVIIRILNREHVPELLTSIANFT